jgi:hypothetical protein
MERKKGSIINNVHCISASFPTTNTHKGILIVLIVGAIQAKQTPIGMSTQGNNRIGKQALYLVKRKEDGHKRLRNIKTETNKVEGLKKDQLLGLS